MEALVVDIRTLFDQVAHAIGNARGSFSLVHAGDAFYNSHSRETLRQYGIKQHSELTVVSVNRLNEVDLDNLRRSLPAARGLKAVLIRSFIQDLPSYKFANGRLDLDSLSALEQNRLRHLVELRTEDGNARRSRSRSRRGLR